MDILVQLNWLNSDNLVLKEASIVSLFPRFHVPVCSYTSNMLHPHQRIPAYEPRVSDLACRQPFDPLCFATCTASFYLIELQNQP